MQAVMYAWRYRKELALYIALKVTYLAPTKLTPSNPYAKHYAVGEGER